MTQDKLKIEVQSEIGKLNAVLLHRPGAEVENMTPNNVQRALYMLLKILPDLAYSL